MNARLRRILYGSITIVLVAAAATTAPAQQADKPENLIKWRQSALQVVGWSTGRIKATVTGEFNRDEVVKAANTLAAVANSGLFLLFASGTEQGKGWHDTNARPELFKERRHFDELAAEFAKQANELAKLASSGDAAAVKEQFFKVASTCKSCHDAFKASN